MRFWEKLRDLPEFKRKIILWLAVVIIGLTIFIFWVKNVGKTLQNFPATELKEQFQFPENGK